MTKNKQLKYINNSNNNMEKIFTELKGVYV